MSKSIEYRLFHHARERAMARGIDFTIELEDISIPDICPVLGIPLIKGPGRIHDASPTLDRLDSSKGYVPGNVAVMSMRANRIKQDSRSDEIRRVADWMEEMGL